MGEEFLRARARIRAAVRERLSAFDQLNIWRTEFFVQRIDLAAEIVPYLHTARRGRPITPQELLDIVREEFEDYIALHDHNGSRAQWDEINPLMQCETCRSSFQPIIDLRCRGCQHPVFFQSNAHGLEELTFSLDLDQRETDPIRRRAILELRQRNLEHAYLYLVIQFERFCTQFNLFLFDNRGLPLQVPMQPNRREMPNPFQRTDPNRPTLEQFKAREWFSQSHHLDIFSSCSAQEVERLLLVFQKRHLLQHKGGIIDQDFLDRYPSSEPAGNPVNLNRGEIMGAIVTVQGMIRHLKQQFVSAMTGTGS